MTDQEIFMLFAMSSAWVTIVSFFFFRPPRVIRDKKPLRCKIGFHKRRKCWVRKYYNSAQGHVVSYIYSRKELPKYGEKGYGQISGPVKRCDRCGKLK